jgi:hypothetical protein
MLQWRTTKDPMKLTDIFIPHPFPTELKEFREEKVDFTVLLVQLGLFVELYDREWNPQKCGLQLLSKHIIDLLNTEDGSPKKNTLQQLRKAIENAQEVDNSDNQLKKKLADGNINYLICTCDSSFDRTNSRYHGQRVISIYSTSAAHREVVIPIKSPLARILLVLLKAKGDWVSIQDILKKAHVTHHQVIQIMQLNASGSAETGLVSPIEIQSRKVRARTTHYRIVAR